MSMFKRKNNVDKFIYYSNTLYMSFNGKSKNLVETGNMHLLIEFFFKSLLVRNNAIRTKDFDWSLDKDFFWNFQIIFRV